MHQTMGHRHVMQSVTLVLDVVEGTIFPFLAASESSVSVPTFTSNAEGTQFTAIWVR
jgi:hypothetical protein